MLIVTDGDHDNCDWESYFHDSKKEDESKIFQDY